jgi:periplasmic protein TonB
MANPFEVDQLDAGIETLLGKTAGIPSDPELRELLAIAESLCVLPDPSFKIRLGAELFDQAKQDSDETMPAESRLTGSLRTDSKLLPTLLGTSPNVYPVQRASFMVSALGHAAVLALLVTVGILAAHGPGLPQVSSEVVTDIHYVLPVAPEASGGGGGGGDRDKRLASKGNPPRFSTEQIAPPAMVVRNEAPRLPADPTVVGPPSLSFPQQGPLGDPLSGVLGPASNGTGSHSGIGAGDDGGVGGGHGPGAGPGSGGGIGGGPFLVGRGVSPPRAIYDPEPEYSDEARGAKYQGSVVLRLVIGSDGRPRDIQVVQSLGMGLDEKAEEAVRQWRFEPAHKEGQPVAVLVDVEVNFRLY